MPFCPDGTTAVNPCFKYLIIFGTLLHWLFALALIVIGAWALQETNKFFYTPIEDFYDILFNISIMMIFCGAIMLIINSCGFVGALRENVILLKIFYISLLVIFLLELIGGILAITFKDKVLEIFSRALKEIYVEEYQEDPDGIMDYFQETYSCCGVGGYTDWNLNMYYNCTEESLSPIKCSVPYSCCKDPAEFTPGLVNVLCGGGSLNKDSPTVDKIWTTGCLPTLTRLAENNLPLIGGVCIAIAIPQLMGIYLGRKLAEQIEDQWRAYKRSLYHPYRKSDKHGKSHRHGYNREADKPHVWSHEHRRESGGFNRQADTPRRGSQLDTPRKGSHAHHRGSDGFIQESDTPRKGSREHGHTFLK